MIKKHYKDIIGFTGAIFLLLGYFLLSWDYLNSKSILYHSLNLVGNILIGYRVYTDRNYANVFMAIIFILIALKSIIQNII